MARSAPIAQVVHPARAAHSARAASWIPEILGWLALFSALALASPGVIAVASAESAAASADSGESCQASEASGELRVQQLQQYIEALRQQAAAHPDAGGDDFVALDNSGFNYRPEQPAAADPADR